MFVVSRSRLLNARSLIAVGVLRSWLWPFASVAYALVCSVPVVQRAFHSEFVVQDDARSYVFWTQRFADPGLFPNDLIANYFQAVSPPGYSALFFVAVRLGADPWVFAKLLPLALGLLATIFCYRLCGRLFPLPLAGFLATVVLSQEIWMNDDVVSATPRAFVYPTFLAFLWLLAGRSWVGSLLALTVVGSFYPQLLLVGGGMFALQLIDWRHLPPRFTSERRTRVFCLLGLGLPLALTTSFAARAIQFGPAIDAGDAARRPEFQPGGRVEFFFPDPVEFWLSRPRSGLMPKEWWDLELPPLHLFVGILLPLMLAFPRRFPLARRISPAATVLPRLVAASLILFFVAHLLLFRLHLPSRYTQHSLRIVLALAAAFVLVLALDAARRRARSWGGVCAYCLVVLAIGLAVMFPALLTLHGGQFARPRYEVNYLGDLYAFLQAQPREIVVASVDEEASAVPVFAARSVQFTREYALAYHTGYADEMSRRAEALVRAHYLDDLDQLRGFLREYSVAYLLVDRRFLTSRYVERTPLLMDYEARLELRASLKRGSPPALAREAARCVAVEVDRFLVIEASCILRD